MAKTDPLLIIAGVLLPFFLFLGFVIWASQRAVTQRRKRTLEAVAQALGVAPPGDSAAPVLEHRSGDQSVQITPIRRGKYEYLQIQLRSSHALPCVVLRKETALDRLGRALGLNRELQLGDRDFDEAVYIESDEQPAHVRALLGDARVRDGAIEICRQGHPLRVERGGLSLLLPTGYKAPAREDIAERVALLQRIAPGLRDVPGALGVPQPAPGDRLAAASLVLLILTYLAFLFTDVARVRMGTALDPAVPQRLAKLGLVVAALCAGGGYVYIRGHSRSLRNYLAVLLASLISAPILPGLLLWTINVAADRAPVRVAAGQVTDLRSTRGKSSSYRVSVTLDEGSDPRALSLRQSYSTYKLLRRGAPVTVDIHRGAFGWAYADAVRPLQAP